MPVQNIECQIAQGQIGRYLSGDSFPSAVVTELEKHIAECPHCQEIVNQKKSMLQAMLRLQNNVPTKAIIELPEESDEDISEKRTPSKPSRQTLSQKLIDRIAQAQETQNATVETSRESVDRKKIFGKPLMYSLALAALLVAMSYVMKDPTKLFGERALPKGATLNDAAPAEATTPATTPTTVPVVTEQEQLDAAVKSASDNITSQIGQGLAANAAKLPEGTGTAITETTPSTTESGANSNTTPASTTPPKAKTTAPAVRKTPVRRPANRTQPRRTSLPGIRVYDKDGNPIK